MSKLHSAEQLIDQIKAGDRSALARAITYVESKHAEHRLVADRLIALCQTVRTNAVRIAVSGPPGVGKSTFIESLGQLIIDGGDSVAVLAIDPTSDQTGGSILGDKTRMQNLSANSNAFIRPSPSSGQLGGVARKTRETILLCEVAKYPFILIETVGVGQSEVTAYRMTDLFLLLLQPGAGDELQGIKRGIVELADLIVVNKADGDRLNQAKQSQQEYKRALHLFPQKDSGQQVDVLLASSTGGEGVPAIWEAIQAHLKAVKETGYFSQKRISQAIYWFDEHFRDQLQDRVQQMPGYIEKSAALKAQIKAGSLSPFQAADELMKWLKW